MSKKDSSFNLIKYLQEVRHELKLVSWPKREDALKLTAIVVAASILIAAYIGALDLGFTNLVNNLLLK